MADIQKIALVTGANKGIGFEITRKLCFCGYKVYMCGRDTGRIKQAAGLMRGEGHTVEATLLDVTDQKSLDEAVAVLKSNDEKLDALVNNAAVLLDDQTNILDISLAQIEATFRTNSIAPLMVTRAFLPMMNEGARVVMLSSGAGAFCGEINDWAPIYSMSKTALNAITRQLAPLLAEKKIAVNAVCPGWVRTTMGGQDATRSVGRGAETPVWLATEVDILDTGKFWRDKKEIEW